MTFSHLLNLTIRYAPVILFGSHVSAQTLVQTKAQALRTTSGFSAQIFDVSATAQPARHLKLGVRGHQSFGEIETNHISHPFQMHRGALTFAQSFKTSWRVDGDVGIVARDFDDARSSQTAEGHLNLVYDMGPWSSVQIQSGREVYADQAQEYGPMKEFMHGSFVGLQAGRVHKNRFRWQAGHRQTQYQDGNKLTNNDVTMYLGEAKSDGSIWVGLGFEQMLNSQPTDLYFSPRQQVKMGPRVEFAHAITPRWQTSWILKWNRVDVAPDRVEANFFGVARFEYKAQKNWKSYLEGEFNHSDNPKDQWSSDTVRVGLDIPL